MSERPERHILLTWSDVDKLIDVLLPQLRAIGTFDGMVMVTRGGVIPGGMLAEVLDITHLLTAAVDFPAKAASAGLMAWPALCANAPSRRAQRPIPALCTTTPIVHFSQKPNPISTVQSPMPSWFIHGKLIVGCVESAWRCRTRIRIRRITFTKPPIF
jgi:hypothetical protein